MGDPRQVPDSPPLKYTTEYMQGITMMSQENRLDQWMSNQFCKFDVHMIVNGPYLFCCSETRLNIWTNTIKNLNGFTGAKKGWAKPSWAWESVYTSNNVHAWLRRLLCERSSTCCPRLSWLLGINKLVPVTVGRCNKKSNCYCCYRGTGT